MLRLGLHMSLKDFLTRVLGIRRGNMSASAEADASPSAAAATEVTAQFIDITPGQELLRKARDMEASLKRRYELESAQQKQRAALETQMLAKYRDLVDKFLEIAERKVCVTDDYGDENWDALPAEVHQCLAKIAKLDKTVNISELDPKSMSAKKISADGERLLFPYASPSTRHLAAVLDSKFRVHHEERKRSRLVSQNLRPLAGVEFETSLSALLKGHGFDVLGTAATGDQGADLVAKKDGKKIAIQAKGYSGTVGNAAVQEVVGALRFYNADEGWVVTNSTFTTAARTLARANNVRLIDGNELEDIANGRKSF
jgi:restriction system protein